MVAYSCPRFSSVSAVVYPVPVVVLSFVASNVLNGLPSLCGADLVEDKLGVCDSLPPGYSLYFSWEVITFSLLKVKVPIVFRKEEL